MCIYCKVSPSAVQRDMGFFVVLEYLERFYPLEILSLKDITYKTVMLVTLLSGQQCQTIHALTFSGMKQTTYIVTFKINKLLKTSKPGKYFGYLQFKMYLFDKQLTLID